MYLIIKKTLITLGLLSIFTASAFAYTASFTMLVVKDKSIPYPITAKEMASYYMNGLGCIVDPGEGIKVLESSWTMAKILGMNNGCIGWVPLNFIN